MPRFCSSWATPRPARSPGPELVAPPRSISDITAILDREKPDPAKRAKAQADADATAPAPGRELGAFLHRRCDARAAIGRVNDAIADCEKALTLVDDDAELYRIHQRLEGQYRQNGDYKRAAQILQEMEKRASDRNRGRLMNIYLRGTVTALQMGDFNRAEAYVKKAAAVFNEARSWPNADKSRTAWESNMEEARARIAEARGRYAEAEASFRKARIATVDAMAKSVTWQSAPPRWTFENNIDWLSAAEGRAKYKQGRLAEAEVDIRRALLSALKTAGKYNANTAQIILIFGGVLNEQARYAEAEKLARAAIEIYDALGYGTSSVNYVGALAQRAGNLYSQRQFDEANALFTEIDNAIRDWEPKRAARFKYSWARIFTALFTRDLPKGIELAREHLAREKARAGEKHYDTALARAVLATGLTFAKNDGEATQEFKLALPVLLGAERDDEDRDPTMAAAADHRVQSVLEAYIELLGRSPNLEQAAIETFQIGERIRGRSVDRALAASTARAAGQQRRLGRPGTQGAGPRQADCGRPRRAHGNAGPTAGRTRREGASADLQTELGKLRETRKDRAARYRAPLPRLRQSAVT